MPSHYAHYRFGSQVIGQLPAEIRRPIQRFRQLYDVGLHGPDLFFYHNLFIKDSAVDLGEKYHQQTGQELFFRVCKRLRLEPTEAGAAYLYGLLAHYCLDSVCSPVISGFAAGENLSRAAVETEFDRHLLVLDGKRPPNTFDCSPHMKLTRGECVTVASFYPPATPGMVNRSIRSMALWVRLLASASGPGRNLRGAALALTGGKLEQHVMHCAPNPACAQLNGQLQDLYGQALEKYPAMLAQLTAHLSHNAPLGEDFTKPFD